MKHLIVPQLDPRLKAIKPKRCRIVYKNRAEFRKEKGQGHSSLAGSIVNKRGISTVYIDAHTPKDSVAHEFGHVALGHECPSIADSRKSWDKIETLREHVGKEIRAWMWVKKNWQERYNIETDLLTKNKWIGKVLYIGQTHYDVSGDEVVNAVVAELGKVGIHISKGMQSKWKKVVNSPEWQADVAKDKREMLKDQRGK